jgi:glycosyltransferase involved in cell wall biosynthesis
MTPSQISVIIPAFNESSSIGTIVEKVRTVMPSAEVIVIDDGSEDDTATIAENAGARIVMHPYNIGNGASIKSGIRSARGDICVFMDGDGQHNPDDIAALMAPMEHVDMVVGARSRKGQASVARAAGNMIYNWMASYVAKFRIRDLTSGFRVVKTEIARDLLHLLPNAFSYPTTMTLAVLRSGFRVTYVPITTHQRKGGGSKIHLFADGMGFILIITKICILYSPLRVFLPVSVMLFLTGLGYYLFTFINYGRFTNMSALLFSTSIIIFMMGLISEQICQMRYDLSMKRRQHAERSIGDAAEEANDQAEK